MSFSTLDLILSKTMACALNVYATAAHLILKESNKHYHYKLETGMIVRFSVEMFPTRNFPMEIPIHEYVDVIIKDFHKEKKSINHGIEKIKVKGFCITKNIDIEFNISNLYIQKENLVFINSIQKIGYFPCCRIKDIIV